MKILRMTNSSDVHPGVPEEMRSPTVAERVFEERTGEPAETVLKALWPRASFPEVLDRWLDEHNPDVVFIRLSSFWVAYESVPLRMERRFGRFGKRINTTGTKVGMQPWFTDRRSMKMVRAGILRAVGGDTHFTPRQVEAMFDIVLRKIAARESVITVVRGTNLLMNPSGTKRGLERCKRRVAELNARVEASCKRYGVAFYPEAPAEKLSDSRLKDDLHDSAEAHQRLGEDDGEAIATEWLKAARTR